MRYLLYLLTILIILPIACSKNSSQPEEDPLRYNYPNYNDGRTGIRHSFYGHDCGDSDYWSGLHRSKEFVTDDTLYFIISEEIGFKQEIPNLTLKERASLVCSNGDIEKVIFDKPYPPCIIHIDGVLLRFGSFPSRGGDLNQNNGFIDVQQDTIEVIIHYKSYWTANIVTDTAYVSP